MIITGQDAAEFFVVLAGGFVLLGLLFLSAVAGVNLYRRKRRRS
jgi:hypothetical protein